MAVAKDLLIRTDISKNTLLPNFPSFFIFTNCYLNQMLNSLAPISLNSSAHEKQRPLSPINLLTDKKAIYTNAVAQANRQLKDLAYNLRLQLKRQREKNRAISDEITCQEQKIAYWRELCRQKQGIASMNGAPSAENSLRPMFEAGRENQQQALMLRKPSRMMQDNVEEDFGNAYDLKERSYPSLEKKKSTTKINSVLAQKARNRKRQALSLTHIHRKVPVNAHQAY